MSQSSRPEDILSQKNEELLKLIDGLSESLLKCASDRETAGATKPITQWLLLSEKARYDEIQTLTKGVFGKKLKQIMSIAINSIDLEQLRRGVKK